MSRLAEISFLHLKRTIKRSTNQLQVVNIQVVVTMNNQYGGNSGFPFQMVGNVGGFVGNGGASAPPYLQQSRSMGGGGVLPPQLQMQAQLGKVLQLGALQQQFIQKFAFNNSEHFHSRASPQSQVPDYNSQDEILRQLHSSESHSEVSPDGTQDTRNTDGNQMAQNLEVARGVKRQLDGQQSPQKKRSCSRDLSNRDLSDGPERPMWFRPDTDSISQFIWEYYNDHYQTQEVCDAKMKLREALYTVIKGVFPYCGLYVVGSSMNGFGSRTSDMDMCLMLSQVEIDQKKEAAEILHIILKALRRCAFLKELNLIRAKVPILKFVDKISNVECDLNINNAVGIRNTHLLSAYSKLDWRVAPLILFIKHWARMQNINDASQGTISSYSLGMMVLHYLQCGCKQPVIPSLQAKYPQKFSPSLDVRLLTLNDKLPSYESPNTQSLGDLFKGFLHYYACEFNFQDSAISVRLGRKLNVRTVMSQNAERNPPSQWKCICIEEPFDLSNTARSVYDLHTFHRIHRVMRASDLRLRKTRDVSSILYQPL